MDVEAALARHLADVDSMATILKEGVKPEYFYTAEAQEMVQFSIDYYVRSNFELAVTEDLLRDEFPRWWDRFEVPEEEYSVHYLIDRIRTRYRRNRTQEVIKSIGVLSVDDPEAALTEGLTQLARIQYDTSTLERQEPYALNYSRRVQEYHDLLMRPGEEYHSNRGFLVGWPEVTEEIWGIKPSEFGVLVAPPSTGKSWALCCLALEAARDGTKTYFCSLENTKEMTLRRLDCMLTGVPWKAYERGRLTREQIEDLEIGKELLEKLQMEETLIVDCPTRMTERTVFELYSRARFSGAQLVVGDQLSWVTARDNYRGDRTAQMAEIVTDMVDLNREFGLASIWAAQFNRVGSKAGRGGLFDIALTSTIEQIVDWAFALSSDKEKRENEMMLFEILKARRGEPRAWLMEWKLRECTSLKVKRVWRDE